MNALTELGLWALMLAVAVAAWDATRMTYREERRAQSDR